MGTQGSKRVSEEGIRSPNEGGDPPVSPFTSPLLAHAAPSRDKIVGSVGSDSTSQRLQNATSSQGQAPTGFSRNERDTRYEHSPGAPLPARQETSSHRALAAQAEPARGPIPSALLASIFFRALTMGLPLEYASNLINVPFQEIQRYMRAGIIQSSPQFTGERDDDVLGFHAQVLQAQAQGHFDRLELINKAGKRSWMAAAWVEERIAPQYFGEVQIAQEKWQVELINALRNGLVTPDDLVNELPYDQAVRLALGAGVPLESIPLPEVAAAHLSAQQRPFISGEVVEVAG